MTTKAAIRVQDRLDFQELSTALARVIDTPRDGQDERGAIYTRREVVEFMLDVAGYLPSERLFEKRLLEPSFGDGDFLIPVIDRLLASWKAKNNKAAPTHSDLAHAICGVELHAKTYAATKARVEEHLRSFGVTQRDASSIASSWLHRGDFLLHPVQVGFDFVVGNPPYVRQELIPQELMLEYRRLYTTVYDRADLYVPFIERSLSLLSPKGVLAFICSDRWTKNRYGRPLRELVSDRYHLKYFVDMVDTAAFHSDVIAYPGIFVITNEPGSGTRIAKKPEISSSALSALSGRLLGTLADSDIIVHEVASVANGGEPWVLDSLDRLSVIRRIETAFPKLEEAGCSVRIGVATGADKVFVGDYEGLDVEPSRKLPLVMTRDIVSGKVKWRGLGVINPFEDDGSLAPLTKYPKLAKYLEEHGRAIRDRHVAEKNPNGWYRTIDRIYPEFASTPKLLIPDIKGEAHVVYESGKLYPHHNLYYITSGTWDLRALQAVLLSSITRAFIATYSTKMRGGYLRFQAQYLRRLRLPQWQGVPHALRRALVSAAKKRDLKACERAVCELYGITKSEHAKLQEQEP